MNRRKTTKTRTCGFCYRKFTYDELPEGSIVFLGICACADCLKTEKTKDFRELVEEPLQWEAIGNA